MGDGLLPQRRDRAGVRRDARRLVGRHGGSMSFVDLDRRFSFGYVPNRWITGAHEMDRSMRLLNEVYLAL